MMRLAFVEDPDGNLIELLESKAAAAAAAACAEYPSTMLAMANSRKGNKFQYGMTTVPAPTIKNARQFIIKVDCAPINPSDLGKLRMAKSISKELTYAEGKVVAELPETFDSFPDGHTESLGGECTGVVVVAGGAHEAQALLGKRVACGRSGGAYAQFALASVDTAMLAVVPEGVGAEQSASVFVNPLTVVGFIQTMKDEGHKGIVHTAAGSQVGRMLVKYCKLKDVPLVNIVRSEQASAALRELGAEHVCVSSSETFQADLHKALVATEATLCFDAVGGGTLASEIIMAMERAILANPNTPPPPQVWYGSIVHKQVYRYGILSSDPQVNLPGLGMAWGIGGWLMPFHYQRRSKTHPTAMKDAQAEIMEHLSTIFTTSYGKRLALDDMANSLRSYLETLNSSTDKKFLVCPNGVEF